ncbi:gliding motility-associated ABC transporter substrate-binding protein GldG [Flavicella sp.]|uniref:gliding motility-associated ABC transporter substrate-binding protein GldG n=1 Tax=Flavicella sp. TaxID=2957742 RepID=UPI00301B1CC5
MLALFKKELRLFFGSFVGYLIITGFLTLNWLWLWALKTDSNIFNSGFADLSQFFYSTAWLFILVVPALTMKAFSDEFQTGTIEILKTKPISDWELILGKFFATVFIIIIMLLPTLFYVYSLYNLATPVGNIEFGSLIGSYIGLLFLAAAFTSIGLWVSSLSKSILIALLVAICFSFLLFSGIQEFAALLPSYNIESLALLTHFTSITRGVIDVRDIIFFVLVSFLFLNLTYFSISTKKNKNRLFYSILIVSIVNVASSTLLYRIDLTEDKKYTISNASIDIIEKIDETAVLKIYLEGDFPPEFKRLQIEAKQLLEELKAINKNLKVFFVDPKDNLPELIKKGLAPSRLTIEENGVISESIILPWATVTYKNKTKNISLLKNSNMKESQEKQLENSIQNLEYAFVSALKKVSSKKEKSIVILTGNGELEDIYLYSLLENLSTNYHLAKFTLDSIKTSPKKSIEYLNSYNLAIIAKPTQAFSEEEKYALDQYTLNGGKSIWMLDNIHAEMDSLRSNGKTLAYTRDLNLDDFFFRYGARVNQNLIKDLYASKIALATGNTGNKTNYENFLWFYAPLVTPISNHPIVHNISPVKFSFVSSIDTLQNNIKKTVLLQSSVLSKEIQIPAIIELNTVIENPDPKTYRNGNKILGLLLEGSFTSAYKDRIKPIKIENPKEIGIPSKMIIISDGDIGKNQVHKGKPLDLGHDKWTQEYFGNKEFLLNSIEYLLDDTGLISIRSKKISLKTLDKNKISQDKTYWQILNLLLPLLFVFVVGGIYLYYRKKIYGKPLL